MGSNNYHTDVLSQSNYDLVYDAINIVEITSAITPATGYTVTNQTHVWKQGKHVFGTIVITQDSGTFNSSNEVAYMNAYRPSRQWVGMCAFSETVWAVSSVGYAFVDSNSPGKVLVEDTKNTNSVVKIQIDYMIS